MELRSAHARLTGNAYQALPGPINPETKLDPAQRFEALLQRFEHVVESRADRPEGISIELPGTDYTTSVWLRLGIYVEKNNASPDGRDVYLSARWGKSKDAADIADEGVFQSLVTSEAGMAKAEPVLRMLEQSVEAAENEVL